MMLDLAGSRWMISRARFHLLIRAMRYASFSITQGECKLMDYREWPRAARSQAQICLFAPMVKARLSMGDMAMVKSPNLFGMPLVPLPPDSSSLRYPLPFLTLSPSLFPSSPILPTLQQTLIFPSSQQPLARTPRLRPPQTRRHRRREESPTHQGRPAIHRRLLRQSQHQEGEGHRQDAQGRRGFPGQAGGYEFRRHELGAHC